MSKEREISSVQTGVSVIRGALSKLSGNPGVYRMLDVKGAALYVGKAKSLKKRVSSYTNIGKLPLRLQRMVALTRSMEFVETHTEAEALLLESNLIKKLKPRYNVLLRDDKSFPYILITGDHDFPLVTKHRGAKKPKGSYYGPFAGAGDVNRTIATLQRAFLLRNCSNAVFDGRSRPCLQYHIKRCTAPCVGKVSRDEYAAQVAEARDFLEGKSKAVQERMAARMQAASDAQEYELAAGYRDRVKALSFVSARQDINVEGLGDVDVIALAQEGGRSCVQVFFFRAGRNYGNRAYFPRHDAEEAPEVILSAFIAQFYENKPVPREVIVSVEPEERALLEEAHKVKISCPMRGKRKRLAGFVENNAAAALERQQAERASEAKLLEGVAELFGLDEKPGRIEGYDNSHISGTNMVGAMIVAGTEGFEKNAYRKFNIKRAGQADDYGMMREVLERRFRKALTKNNPPSLREGVRGRVSNADQSVDTVNPHLNPPPQGGGDSFLSDIGGEDWPDVLLIDGGQGQFNAAKEVLEECGIFEALSLVAIAKGQDRHAGREKFFMEGRAPFQLPVNDPVLHYLQRLRDEAHRFAIGTHRARRQKQITSSPLDEIAGVGAKRKKALLHYFGSAKAVAQAGVADLEKVEGISKAVAQKIYDHFH